MLVQSTQSRKSWKSRSRLVEIDTVDFLFRRLIYTCICTGKFQIYIAARNSRPVSYQKVIKVYVQILCRKYPPQIPLHLYYPHICFTLLSWDRNLFDSFFPTICLHSIFILSPYLIYYLWTEEVTFAVYRCLPFRCFIEMEDSDSLASNGREHGCSYYSIYSNFFVSYRY